MGMGISIGMGPSSIPIPSPSPRSFHLGAAACCSLKVKLIQHWVCEYPYAIWPGHSTGTINACL